MTNLDYLYNKKDSRKFFRRNHFVDKNLSFKIIEHGIIFPHYKNLVADTATLWWGRGGVVDNQGNFIEGSLVGKGTGGVYETTEAIKKSSETVIYLGLFANSWGHAFTINFQRLWFLTSELLANEFKNCPLVYLPWKNDTNNVHKLRNFRRMLEILGINPDSIQPITQPTQFENVIVPDKSFFAHRGFRFTKEYRETIDRLRTFALKNRTSTASKKIYYFYGNIQVGEERIAEYFKSKGYEIVSPEKLTLDEQLNLLINCDSFASTLGSCAHNSVFLRDGTEAIFIPRSANHFTGYQQALNQVHPINAYYVDSTLSLFGKIHGPNCFIISKQLKKFFGESFESYDEVDFKIFLTYVKLSMRAGLKFNDKALKYYAPIYQGFLEQLKQREDLLQAYGITLA